MKLMTAEIAKRIPKTMSTEKVPLEEKLVVLKFFDPTGRGTWFVIEGEQYHGDNWEFFGYVLSPLGEDCDELGYFHLSELQSVKGRFGLGIERDLHFEPQKLGDLVPAVRS